MSNDFSHLRHWLTGEGYGPNYIPRPVILECIPSRSGMSMGVHDRGERIFTVNGCGFDRIGTALATFLESHFQPELGNVARKLRPIPNDPETTPHWMKWSRSKEFFGFEWDRSFAVHLEGATGFESMQSVAEALNLKVTRSESKAGTLIIIEKGV